MLPDAELDAIGLAFLVDNIGAQADDDDDQGADDEIEAIAAGQDKSPNR